MLKRITVRLTMAIATTLLLVLSLMVFLNYTKFQKIFLSFHQERLVYLITEMRDTIEFSLGLGLPLADLENIQELLNRQQQDDDQILFIRLTDPANTLLFATNKGETDHHPPTDQPPAPQQTSSLEISQHQDTTIITTPLINGIGQVAGHLTLCASRLHSKAILRTILLDMVKTGSLLLAGSAFLTLLLAWLLLHRTMHRFDRVSEILQTIPSGERITTATIKNMEPLEQRFLTISTPIQSALDEMEALRETLAPAENIPPAKGQQ